MTKTNLIDTLTSLIIEANPDFEVLDSVYVKNRIIALIGDDFFNRLTENNSIRDIVFEITSDEILQSYLFDLVTPKTSTINRTFWELHSIDPSSATNYFHDLSIANDYLKVAQIAKNIKFKSPTKYGDLEITINLSKPEKTVKQIANNKNTVREYPKCPICLENEGYQGGNGYAVRTQHRVVHMELNKQKWFMQFSPYEYFNEHVIVINKNHSPMKINNDTFDNLLDFVDLFPHYLIGSNADIPIVGGSLLGHEHYQGGKHIFPIEKSKTLFNFETTFSDINAEVIDWPVSTIRLTSMNRNHLVEYCKKVLDKWLSFDNKELNIKAYDGETKHHSLNPIVRKQDNQYVIYLLLRDNNTSPEFPDGIFHVHPEYHHIKQENIGLIEAMGLAILPGRLKSELQKVKDYILNENFDLTNVAEIHQSWAKELKNKYNSEDIDKYVDNQLGIVFQNLLENTGVFFNHPESFKKFIEVINK